MKTARSAFALAAVFTLALSAAGCGSSGPDANAQATVEVFDALPAAKSSAAETNKPILLDLYADWCAPCNQFKEDMASDAALKKTLAGVTMLAINAEEGDGEALAERFEIGGFPTFIMLRHDGELIDQWGGYELNELIERVETNIADPTTLEEKIARFENEPSLTGAVKLAEIHAGLDKNQAALDYYRKAAELDPDGGHEMGIFYALEALVLEDKAEIEELKIAADAAMKGAGEDSLQIAWNMVTVAKRREVDGLFEPYVIQALKQNTDAPQDEYAQHYWNKLRVTHALRIEKDPVRAASLKREALGEGWQDDAKLLNAYAWWCFENEVDLEDAEMYARKGVELADGDSTKAMILDTVAEICNLRGNCGDSVELIAQAIELDPENDYYQSQLNRFQELVALNK